ncbi:helix-turn-helix domain-containing protein [Streptomyces sp. NPDC049577]|uniref:helix-turn-helix domain-containing protein n=1 Tax=Streptomyces sp. NPDC049577 TaxID=3155153 RepID=UPI00341C3A9F
MGWWEIDADTLAHSRFVVSALAETTAGLLALERGAAAHPGEQAWLDAHRGAYRERLAGDPVTAALVKAAVGRRWIADFLAPPPGEGEAGFEEELAVVRGTPVGTVRADLAVSLGGRPLPGVLRDRSDPAERAAELLAWVWEETVRPSWPHRRRVIEAEVVARAAQLSQGGWAAALDDLRPGMGWLGEGRLRVNPYGNPPRRIPGTGVTFVPVTPRHGWVATDPARHRYALVYPCSGALAAVDRPAVPEALGRLLGAGRAGVLVLLGSPKSTTQLVALTGQGLGSVGRHLKVLLDARLIGRRRAGRSVLYYRTAAGEALVEAQDARSEKV